MIYFGQYLLLLLLNHGVYMQLLTCSKMGTKLDKSLASTRDVPSIEVNSRNIQTMLNQQRIKKIIQQASVRNDQPSSKEVSHQRSTTNRVLERCPHVPPGLRSLESAAVIYQQMKNFTGGSLTASMWHLGQNEVKYRTFEILTERDIIYRNPSLRLGGSWRPDNCTARHKVAIVVPYRDRGEHLRILLAHLHPVLQRQQLDYIVIVIEQEGNDIFNKALIMNAAFIEGLKLHNFHCVVFHDVDLVPEDDRNMYSCPVQPRHMAVAIDEEGYKNIYDGLVGGVLSMRREHFQQINGFSNLYWGWGAEDDDMYYRIKNNGLTVIRPPPCLGRYNMIKHKKREREKHIRKRVALLSGGRARMKCDGLNSLKYKLVFIEKRSLYTHIMVNVGKPPQEFT